MHQCRHPDLWRSVVGDLTLVLLALAAAFHKQMPFEFLTAATLQTGTIAAQRNETIDQQTLGKNLLQASAENGGYEPKSRSGNAGQGLLPALHGGTRAASFTITGHIKCPGGFEAFGQGVPGAPRHHEQDKKQRVGPPARAARASHGLMSLLPKLRCEKIA